MLFHLSEGIPTRARCRVVPGTSPLGESLACHGASVALSFPWAIVRLRLRSLAIGGDGNVDVARCNQGQSHRGDEAALSGQGRKFSGKPEDIRPGISQRGVVTR